jgi:hypothetical protein
MGIVNIRDRERNQDRVKMKASDAVQYTLQVALWQCVFDRKQTDRQCDGQINKVMDGQAD